MLTIKRELRKAANFVIQHERSYTQPAARWITLSDDVRTRIRPRRSDAKFLPRIPDARGINLGIRASPAG